VLLAFNVLGIFEERSLHNMVNLTDLPLAALLIISNLVVVFDQIDELLSHTIRFNDSFFASFSVAFQRFPLLFLKELIKVLVKDNTFFDSLVAVFLEYFSQFVCFF